MINLKTTIKILTVIRISLSDKILTKVIQWLVESCIKNDIFPMKFIIHYYDFVTCRTVAIEEYEEYDPLSFLLVRCLQTHLPMLRLWTSGADLTNNFISSQLSIKFLAGDWQSIHQLGHAGSSRDCCGSSHTQVLCGSWNSSNVATNSYFGNVCPYCSRLGITGIIIPTCMKNDEPLFFFLIEGHNLARSQLHGDRAQSS